MNVFARDARSRVVAWKKMRRRKGKPSNSVLGIIGNTPIVELGKLSKTVKKRSARIFAKLEFLNPSGSIKDRMVLYAIEAAEKRGELKKNATIVEATSGNTGIALSMVAAVKGYNAVIVLPKTTSDEKIEILEAFGAKLILTPPKKGIKGTIEKAKQVAKNKRAFLLNQFENPDNVRSHEITGKEILEQVKNVDAFVAGIGTGGTLIGVAKVLKRKNPRARIVAVEPAKVPAFYNMFYQKNLLVKHGIPHKIEGIGEGFVPKILSENKNLVDEVMLVKDEDAIKMAKRLAKKEGLFVGPSSGANVWAAMRLAKKMGRGKNVTTVLPDTGQRYLSGVF